MGVQSKAGTKAAFNEVLDAIRTLKSLEATGRQAGPADKAVMAKFCGFGPFATKAFPDPATGEYAEGWEALGETLRELLTDEEYASAKGTTFTAFYTSDVVMAEMYRAVERMGIGMGARGLEPGCGVGNFIGASPVIGLDFIGVEKDSLSGRMAHMIHPEHDIRVQPFQDVQLPENSVDFAIGNVPFADIKLRHRGQRHSLHDFFFLKSLDAVRPGGVMALVTSRYTLDKASPKVRQLLAEQADFAGAIRLPSEAFKGQGTSVVTDIVFLRKKPTELDVEKETPAWVGDLSWLSASKAELDGGEVTLNDYFKRNPHMVIGDMTVGQGMYGNNELRVRSDAEIGAALARAVDGLPANIVTARTAPLVTATATVIDPELAAANLQEGSYFIAADQTIMQVVGGQAEPVMQREKPLKANGTPGGKKLAGLITLKERARAVLRAQQDGLPDAERDEARRQLRTSYASFIAQFGPINKTTISVRKDGAVSRRMPNVVRFRSDPDVYLVMALENYDERSGVGTPATIMQKDVVVPAAEVGEVESAKDGLLASLNHLGSVDIPYIAKLYGQPEPVVVEELAGLIYFDPIQDGYVPADEYLSGNVRQKLLIAEISSDPRTEGNAEALKAVQPEDLVAEEIDITLGTPWIPAEDVERFLVETMGIAPSSVTVEYVNKEALWKVRINPSYRQSAVASSEFGTEDVDAYTLVEQALNMRSPTVRRRVPGGPGESDTYVVDQEATVAAREKQAILKQTFSGWAFDDEARSERLVRFYNNNFNNIRLREFNGDHLTFDRMSTAFSMYKHQKAAVWRNMSSGNTLLAHVVGAGKTFEMIATGMEMKRTGLARKPLFVVPNHMLEQFSREYLVLYPDANILVATKRDLTKDRRQLLKCRMATGDWDGIVMTHSSFQKISMSPAFQARFIANELAEYEELLTDVEDRSLKANIIKKVEKLKAQREEKLKDMAEAGDKDDGLYFDELGIDQVFIDEAHMFKNLETKTKMDRVAGIQTNGSNRAFDLFMKARYLQSRTPGRGLTFATGTPVSNSLGEMYTMMRYLIPEVLEERGIAHFDAWAANFGEVINSLEISPDGKSLRVNTRFAKFKNLPELLALFRLTADVQTGAMLKLPVPELKGGKAEVVAAPMSELGIDFQDELVKRYERVRAGGIDPAVDNALAIITDGRKLALDPRLVSGMADDDPDSKINQLVDKVYEIWARTKDDRSTQMIFSDLGVKPTDWDFCVYDDIVDKLEARGVPSDEIACIGDAKNDQQKESLFSKVRSGHVRILLGSTAKMGTGTNVQKRLVALHHVDPPWRPADIEQREGRILRQGNIHKELNIPVEIYRYVTEGSFDAFMWQTLETKAKFIAQAMAGDAGTRRADDIGGAELSFAEVKAIATGNPAMLVLAEMDLDVRQLRLLRTAHGRDQAKIKAELQRLPGWIEYDKAEIAKLEQDIERRQETKGDAFLMTVGDRTFKREKGEKKTARIRAQGALELAIAQAYVDNRGPMPWEMKLGELGGLDIVLNAEVDALTKGGRYSLTLEGADSYLVANKISPTACPPFIHDLEQQLRTFDGRLARLRADLEKRSSDLERYSERAGAAFPQEAAFLELAPLRDKLKALLQQEEAEDSVTVQAEIDGVVEAYRNLDVHAEQPAKHETVVDDVPAPAEVPEVAVSVAEPVTTPVETDHVEAVAVEPVADDVPAPAEVPTVAVSAAEPATTSVETDHVEAVAVEPVAEVPAPAEVPTAAVSAAEPATTPVETDHVEAVAVEPVAEVPAPAEVPTAAVSAAEPATTPVETDHVEAVAVEPVAKVQAPEVDISAPLDILTFGDLAQPIDTNTELALVRVDGGCSLAAKQGDVWSIQNLYPLYPDNPNRLHERRIYGWRDDAWVTENLATAEWLEVISDLGQYLTEAEKNQLVFPQQRDHVLPAELVGVADADEPAPAPVDAAPTEAVEPAVETSIGEDNALAIVGDVEDGITWFQLARKIPGHDAWSIMSLYPQFTEHERRTGLRKGDGTRDESWVREHVASADMLDELAQYLTAEELSRVIPAQRVHLAQQVDASVQIPAEQPAQDHALSETPTPTAPVDERPVPSPVPATGKGQMGLLFDAPEEPAKEPSPAATERATAPIPRHAVQMGLFGERQPTASASHSVVAESYRPAAKEVRVQVVDDGWTEGDEALFREEMEWRGKLGKDDPLYVAPQAPEIAFEDLDDREQRQVVEIGLEFDYLWEGATWGQAIGSYEDKFACRISDRLYDYLTADDPKHKPTPWDDLEPAPPAPNQEIAQWQQSLSGAEERDMQDMLENGHLAGAPRPSERAVLGRFTSMVGEKAGIGQIIHDAMEHYESYGSMVERIERETGHSAADDRATRSLYNATLARRSGWER